MRCGLGRFMLQVRILMSNKKGGEVSTFFAPNLTMNLTYLCYGKSKVGGRASLKAINPINSGYYR